jgi:chorismate mutase
MNEKIIKKLRKRVDAIDSKLVSLLAERFKTTREIISLKKENGLGVKDEKREVIILKEVGGLAKKLKISTDLVADIFKKILRESKK